MELQMNVCASARGATRIVRSTVPITLNVFVIIITASSCIQGEQKILLTTDKSLSTGVCLPTMASSFLIFDEKQAQRPYANKRDFNHGVLATDLNNAARLTRTWRNIFAVSVVCELPAHYFC